MWLNKSFYELLPLYYVAMGAAAMVAGFYVEHSYWQPLLLLAGFIAIVGGLTVWLKRRDYRSSRSRVDFDKLD